MIFFGWFIIGCLIGSTLTAVALLLAIGVTAQREATPYAPMRIPYQATIGPQPCPTCGDEMSPVKSQMRPGFTGWECSEHGIMAWVNVG